MCKNIKEYVNTEQNWFRSCAEEYKKKGMTISGLFLWQIHFLKTFNEECLPQQRLYNSLSNIWLINTLFQSYFNYIKHGIEIYLNGSFRNEMVMKKNISNILHNGITQLSLSHLLLHNHPAQFLYDYVHI